MLICKNVNVGSRRTSIKLEREMWTAVEELCRRESLTLHQLCSWLDRHRRAGSLTAALRVILVSYYRSAATDEGHARAGHGAGADRIAAQWHNVLARAFGER